MTTETQVLDHQEIMDRIQRIAWQIYENHQEESQLVLVGIAERGFLLAEKLTEKLREISPLEVTLLKIKVDKKNPRNQKPILKPDNQALENTSVVVVDDVLNSGATLIYAVKYFLDFDVKQIKTAVLVDRNHKNFPIKADFKGLSLSTNLLEHVEVYIQDTPFSVKVS